MSKTAPTEPPEWWRSAVIYQVYPKSFADSDGDGVGDLPGITSRLDYLKSLGVDAVWISPFYPSPQKDGGYDVSDYTDVDPTFGTIGNAQTLIDRAHGLGMRVIVDIVPNHTSDAHAWFQRALAAPPGSPERDWYIFRTPDPAHPETPPNNWPSEFGGAAWSKTPAHAAGTPQWYLHLFDSSQPDLNWDNPEVREAFEGILRFWLDKGVDGFRVDVAHGLVKAPGLPDSPLSRIELKDETVPTNVSPYWDQNGVHDIYRQWRAILDEYPGERIMVAEAWVHPQERLARYVRPGAHNHAFNLEFLGSAWNAEALRTNIRVSLQATTSVGAPTTWVLSNHDVIRTATRLALHPSEMVIQLDGPLDTPPAEVSQRRARSAATLMLALPGSVYLYQGEELGLPEVLDIAPDARRDPTFFRTRGHRLGRDGCRVPLPWDATAPSFGFSTPPAGSANTAGAAKPWLPQPDWFSKFAVNRLEADPHSVLALYRALIAHRHARDLGNGQLRILADWASSNPDLLVFDVLSHAGTTRCVVNLGVEPWQVPDTHAVIVASAPLRSGVLEPDTAAWFVP